MSSFYSALEDQISKTRPVVGLRPSFRGCIYGESGEGKTVLAAQILDEIVPDDKGILHIDTSEGFVSIDNVAGLGNRIVTIPYESIEQIELLVEGIKAKYGMLAHIGGVLLDEASSMNEQDIDEHHRNRLLAEKTESLTPEWDDYRPALVRFRKMMAQLFSVRGLNVVLVAHLTRENKGKNQPDRCYPAFPPKTAPKVKEPLHFVGCLTSGLRKSNTESGEPTYERLVQVHPTRSFDAKTRLPIPRLKVGAEELPSIIRKWLDEGGKPETTKIYEEEKETFIEPNELNQEDNALSDDTDDNTLSDDTFEIEPLTT